MDSRKLRLDLSEGNPNAEVEFLTGEGQHIFTASHVTYRDGKPRVHLVPARDDTGGQDHPPTQPEPARSVVVRHPPGL